MLLESGERSTEEKYAQQEEKVIECCSYSAPLNEY